jgi:hypothetical protein
VCECTVRESLPIEVFKSTQAVCVCRRFSVVDLMGTENIVGTLTEPTLGDSSGGGLYQISLDVSSFPNGDG